MEEQHNPYGSPDASLQPVVPPPLPGTLELASPWIRFGAAWIDGILALLTMLPVMLLGGYWDTLMEADSLAWSDSLLITLGWSAVGFVLFLLLQGYPLHRWGQTWGKRIVGVQIVDLNGQHPGLSRLVLWRYLPLQLVAVVPFVGNLSIIVDSLFIFRDDHRCVHDLIAGTQVIVNRPQ